MEDEQRRIEETERLLQLIDEIKEINDLIRLDSYLLQIIKDRR